MELIMPRSINRENGKDCKGWFVLIVLMNWRGFILLVQPWRR